MSQAWEEIRKRREKTKKVLARQSEKAYATWERKKREGKDVCSLTSKEQTSLQHQFSKK